MDALEVEEEYDDVTGIPIEPPEVRAETDKELDSALTNRRTGF